MEQAAVETRTCICGYDLAGLPGPPWVCPECNETWTPPVRPKIAGFPYTRAERWLIGIGTLLFVPSAMLSWQFSSWWESRALGFLPSIVAISIAAVAITLRWVRWDRHIEGDRYDHSTELPRAGVYFLAAWVRAALVGGVIFAVIGILIAMLIFLAVGLR